MYLCWRLLVLVRLMLVFEVVGLNVASISSRNNGWPKLRQAAFSF